MTSERLEKLSKIGESITLAAEKKIAEALITLLGGDIDGNTNGNSNK